jgi:hypothetical protein
MTRGQDQGNLSEIRDAELIETIDNNERTLGNSTELEKKRRLGRSVTKFKAISEGGITS